MTPTEIDEVKELIALMEEQIAALEAVATRINEIFE